MQGLQFKALGGIPLLVALLCSSTGSRMMANRHFEPSPSSCSLQVGSNDEWEEINLRFVDAYGYVPKDTKRVVIYLYGSEERICYEPPRDSEGIWQFSYKVPGNDVAWRPKITYAYRLHSGGVSLEATVDLSSLDKTVENPSIISLNAWGDGSYVIRGRVIDEMGAPLSNARVYLFSSSSESVAPEVTALAENSGGFWLSPWVDESDNQGSFFLRVTCPGYRHEIVPFSPKAEGLQVQLRKGEPITGNLALPDGVIGGKLLFVSGPEEQISSVCDDGNFAVFGIDEGDWRVTYSRNDLSFPLADTVNKSQAPLAFDLCSTTWGLTLHLAGSSGESIDAANLVLQDKAITVTSGEPILLPLATVAGTLAKEGFADLPIDFCEPEIWAVMPPMIPVELVLNIPEWLDAQVLHVYATEIEQPSFFQRQVQLSRKDSAFYGGVSRPGTYAFALAILERSALARISETILLVNGEEAVHVPEEGLANLSLDIDPAWLKKVDRLVNKN